MIEKVKQVFTILTISLLLCLGVFTIFIKEQEPISRIENRYLTVNTELNVSIMLNNTYASIIESILTDQFPNRYFFIELKNQINYQSSEAIYKYLNNPFILKQVASTPLYKIGDTPFLTPYPLKYDLDYEKRIIDRIDQINRISIDFTDVNFYVYKPTQFYETNLLDAFNNIESYGTYYNNLFKLNLNVPYSYLKLETFDNYSEYFYFSDHHWSHKGIHQGYLDIIELIFSNIDDALIPWGENCFNNLKFKGTYSSITGHIFEGAPFCVYGYEMPDYQLIVNNEVLPNHLDTNNFYFFGPFHPDAYHYNDAYMLTPQRSEVIELVTNHPSQESILIVGDSYGPAVLPLLSKHFNHIYFVNPSTYFDITKQMFNYYSFIEAHEVENVLFMYILDNFIVSDDWGERYKMFDIIKD